MNQQKLLVRKIIYLSGIALLLYPLWLLSQPRTTQSEGGKLARLRASAGLSEANLGQIDPTSASMKLASFGLHGAAATKLWTSALSYKEREDYTNFDAALEQITYLQPHFVKVWEFQGHNVAFNISVEFDDYRKRYQYVIKGFNLLKKGIRYNEKDPKLLRSLAHFTGFKIGRSDEKQFYRVLYRNDEDFHAPKNDQNPLLGSRYHRPEAMRDNWLVSKWWYREAEKLVELGQAQYSSMNMNPLRYGANETETRYGPINAFLLHSDAPRQQMQYAETIEEEGEFGPKAQMAWATAKEEWDEFGSKDIPTTLGFTVRLNRLDTFTALRDKRRKELEELEPGLPDALQQKVIDELSPDELAAWKKPRAERSEQEVAMVRDIERRRRVTPEMIAAAMPEDKRQDALQLVERVNYAGERVRMIETYRTVVNYEYWGERTRIEQSPETIAARESVYRAKEKYTKGDLPGARERFDEGILQWASVLKRFPVLLDHDAMVRDLYEMIRSYRELLAQTRDDGSSELPDDFPLQMVVDKHDAVPQPEEDSAADETESEELQPETSRTEDEENNDNPES
ncbi:MAG: hypothetical protein WBF93_13035 [Pirellulales bacterium]